MAFRSVLRHFYDKGALFALYSIHEFVLFSIRIALYPLVKKVLVCA